MRPTFVALFLLVAPFACASRPDGGGASAPAPVSTATSLAASAGPEVPQSYTPETRPHQRAAAIRQRWTAHVGKTDHRTTMAYVGGEIVLGTHGGGAGAGVWVVDGKTGAARPMTPAARGDVIGIAIEKDRIYSTSSGGEVVAATRDGHVVFRAELGAAATTPPTLVALSDGGLAVAVGDAKGRVTLLDASTGKKRWSAFVGPEKDARPIGAGLAVADTDKDGIPEIYAGSENGWLVGLHATKGDVSWSMSKSSALRAAPILADLDADGRLELLAAWADGDVGIYDGHGKEKWSAHVERDNGDPTGILASPTPVPGLRIGSLLVPTARWGKDDGVVLLRKHFRAYQSQQGRVTAAAVLGVLEPGSSVVEAVVGTQAGDVVSFDATGSVSFMYKLDGPIEASAMIADLDGDGLRELLVATADGKLVALALQTASPPVLSRARGDSLRNTGVLPSIDLAWSLSEEP